MASVTIIGAGKMGISHYAIVNAHRNASVVAVCDTSSYVLSVLRKYTGVETQTIYEHYDNFIKALSERGLTDEQIGMVLGGNYLRVWRQILPDA